MDKSFNNSAGFEYYINEDNQLYIIIDILYIIK